MADQEISQLNTCIEMLLNADCFLHWELQALEENRHEEDLSLADGFFYFTDQLLKIHELYSKKDFTEALQLIHKLEKNIKKKLENTLCVLSRIPRVINHVVNFSKATVLLHCGRTTECYETLNVMTSHRDLNEIEKAAILAIRSACCAMYSFHGIENAKGFVDRAIRKDNKTPFWRFLKAVFLYKKRTALNPLDPPSLEELEILKSVNREEEKNPLFMVYLADVYRESANVNKNQKELNFWYIPKETQNTLKTECEEMYKESKALYEGAYELRPECPVVGFRVANGLMKLPQLYHNVKLAKEIFEKHTEANRGYGNLVEAFYLYQFGKKPELARRCLEASMELNVFNAHMNYIKLMFKDNREQFDIEILKKLLRVFDEAPKKKIIHAQLISYFLFIRNDLKTACQNMMECLKIGGPQKSLERHVSFFLDTSEQFSLIDVIVDQVKFSVKILPSTCELREFLDAYIHFTHFHNLSADWKSPPQNLRKQILDKKVPDLKTRTLPEPRTNTNPKSGANRAPNQPNKTQRGKPGGFPKANPKNFHSKNTPGHSNWNKNAKSSGQVPVPPTTTANLEKKSAPAPEGSSYRKNDRDGNRKDVREHEEYRGRRSRHSSVSSSDSDRDRRSRRKKKHHRHRRYSTSTSESDSRDRRHRSPSRSRERKEHKKRHDKHRHRRYSSTSYSSSSSDSSSSYDRYKKKGRKHHRRRSYTVSNASSPERRGKKKSSHRSRERGEGDNLRKKMEHMSVGDHDQKSSRRE